MKRFQFRLQKLLEIRQKKEDREKIELAKASGAYQLEVNKKQKVLNMLNNYRGQLGKNKKLTLRELQEYDRLVSNSDAALGIIEEEIARKKEIMNTHIERYAKLKQERMAVEKLKERAWKRYQEEEKREQQRMLDEIGQNIYLRNKDKVSNSEDNNVR